MCLNERGFSYVLWELQRQRLESEDVTETLMSDLQEQAERMPAYVRRLADALRERTLKRKEEWDLKWPKESS